MAALLSQGIAMKLDALIKLALFLFGIHLSTGVYAHPEDSPLTFIAHKTEDGRIIYTNIPKRCFSNGVLTCTRYHPIYNSNRRQAASVSSD